MLPLATPAVDQVLAAVPYVALGVAFVVLVWSVVVVGDDERLVVTGRDGEVRRVLDDGVHLTWPHRSGRTLDAGTLGFGFSGGEAETADGVVVEFDVAGAVSVDDAASVVAATDAYPDDLEAQVAAAVRTQVGYLEWAELRDDRETLSAACRRQLDAELGDWGIALERFEVERVARAE